MGMGDANKRIDLAAPLISVRRYASAETTAARATTGLPANKADATSGPLGHTGAVPFRWEHRPGHPKSVRTRRPPPPPTIADHEPSRLAREPTAAVVAARDEAERFWDALSGRDDASCVTVNCSATGISDAAGAGAGAGPRAARGCVMMDRFLSAAHAVAAGSPQNTFRKAGSARPAAAASPPSAADRAPAQRRLPFQQTAAYRLPPFSPEGKSYGDGDGGGESDAHSTAGFASRRCGLLPTRCVKTAVLLSHGARRAAGRPFLSKDGGRSQKGTNPLLRCSRNGLQQQPQQSGDDPGGTQSWEEVYIKSLLRSGRGGGGGGGLMGLGPAAAVASELDRTVRELYRRRAGQAVHPKPKASHLGLLLVLDRSNEACGHGSPERKLCKTGDAASLLPATTTKSSPVAGREMVLSPQQPLLSFPLPRSPTESWLSRALPSVSTRPPATSFLGLHVQLKKNAPSPWSSIDSGNGVDHDGQRRIRLHDLQK